VDTAFRQVDQTHAVIDISDVNNFNHIVIDIVHSVEEWRIHLSQHITIAAMYQLACDFTENSALLCLVYFVKLQLAVTVSIY